MVSRVFFPQGREPHVKEVTMAQAHVVLENHRMPSALWARVAASMTTLKERRQQKRAVARMLGELEAGRATGARV